MNIYLCGPINGCTDDQASGWREWFKRADCFKWIDPMKRDYRGVESENYREIVELDKRDILLADAVVVMYTQPSVGASMEMFWAWHCNLPMVLIDNSEGSLSPWLIYHTTAIVKTKEEALAKLKEWQ